MAYGWGKNSSFYSFFLMADSQKGHSTSFMLHCGVGLHHRNGSLNICVASPISERSLHMARAILTSLSELLLNTKCRTTETRVHLCGLWCSLFDWRARSPWLRAKLSSGPPLPVLLKRSVRLTCWSSCQYEDASVSLNCSPSVPTGSVGVVLLAP